MLINRAFVRNQRCRERRIRRWWRRASKLYELCIEARRIAGICGSYGGV